MSDRLAKIFDEEYAQRIAYWNGKIKRPGTSPFTMARIAEAVWKVGLGEAEVLASRSLKTP